MFYLSGFCFPPASGRTISVLRWADIEIWRAGWWFLIEITRGDLTAADTVITQCRKMAQHWPNNRADRYIGQSLTTAIIYTLVHVHCTYSYMLYGCKVGKDYSSPSCSSAASWETRSFLSKHSSYMPWAEHCAEPQTQRNANVGLFSLLFCSRNVRMNNSCM